MRSILCALICSTLLITYSDAGPEGLGFVKIDGKFGFIDTKRNFAINPQFHYAESFAEGLVFVEVNGKWGIKAILSLNHSSITRGRLQNDWPA